MLYEYALISVLLACGYWGWYFLRRRPTGTPTFGIMLVGAAALSGLGLLGRKYDDDLLGVAGAIGVGAGVCLLILGPLVRGVARRFAAAERLGVASRLLDVAEILAPGSGVNEEKAVLGAMKEIRDGRVEQTVDALTAAKEQVPVEARLAIDERIAMLYLAAYRWTDAIAHAEAHLFGAAAEPRPASPSLRDTLGIAPQIWVELIGAYGRIGDLERAAGMLVRLEDACENREDSGVWLHRARMMFLALAGRPESVRRLVGGRTAKHMSPAARTYWVAVAHEHRGDREAATAAYEKARDRSRGRPRVLIDQALEQLANARPAELTPATLEIVARVEAAPLPAPIRMARTHRPWATFALTGALLAVAGVIGLAVGPSADPGVLLRSGALAHGRVDDGEWWRLVSCIFVHVGLVHLIVNAIGMYFLGRIAEELFDSARTVAIFAIAGIAGSLASYLASPAGVSAGASGAIFGLLGAVFAELTLHRERYRAAWKRGMWGGLVVVTLAQLGVGFVYPVIDQWAHGAGLAAGGLAGALLSRQSRFANVARYVGRGVALMFAAFALTAAVLVARTSVTDSLTSGPTARHVLPAVDRGYTAAAITAPAFWESSGGIVGDTDGFVLVRIEAPGRKPVAAAQIAVWLARATHDMKERFTEVTTARDRAVPLPPGWEGGELLGFYEDPMEYREQFRVVACVRMFGDVAVELWLVTPESIVRELAPFLTTLIASAGPA